MRNIMFMTLVGACATLHGPAFGQSLTKVDCSAFQKQGDGAYAVLEDTAIVDVSNNTIQLSKGLSIGPHSININGYSGRDMIDQKCSAGAAPVDQALATTASIAAPATADVVPPPLSDTPTPPPLPPQPQFFYNGGGKPVGPISLADLKAKLAARTIDTSTLVWKVGTPNWATAKDIPELNACAAADCGSHPVPDQHVDMHSFFVGTWEIEGPAPNGAEGTETMRLSLAPDGGLQGTLTIHLAGSGATAVIPMTGNWTVAPLSEKEANVTLNVLLHDNSGQEHSVNKTTALEIVDHDTVRDLKLGTLSKRVAG